MLPKPKYTVELGVESGGRRPESNTLLSKEYLRKLPRKDLGTKFKVCFKDFKDNSGRFSISTERRISEHDLPASNLIFLTFVYVAGYSYAGKFEKVAWTIAFRYQDQPFAFSLQKFGLRLYYMGVETPPLELIRSMLSDLNDCIALTREIVKPFFLDQITAGNVTVVNAYKQFSEMYDFFRKHAEQAFSHKTCIAQKKQVDQYALSYQKHKEGGYFSLSMCDAYFSRLDHLMMLLLPFTVYVPGKMDLSNVINSSGMSKFRLIFAVEKDKQADNYLRAMIAIRERFRNPVAHGNFEKDGKSFFVHVPHLGAVPMPVGTGSSCSTSIHKINEKSFQHICMLFDDVDKFIQGKCRYGLKNAQAGLDVAFDNASVCGYRAIDSDEVFDSYVECRNYQIDMAMDMDW